MRIPFFGPILQIPVALLWIFGYGTWYVSSLIEKKIHPHKTNGWYTFAEFKTQHEISALLGAVAAILMLLIPKLLVPIAWLFLISNVFWSIAAHHESNVEHPDDHDFSTEQQTVYSYLAFAITAISLITALGATASMFFPLAAPALLPVLTAITIGLACIAIGLSMKWYFGTYETDLAKRERDKNNGAQNDNDPEPNITHSPAETVFPSPLNTTQNTIQNIEPTLGLSKN